MMLSLVIVLAAVLSNLPIGFPGLLRLLKGARYKGRLCDFP